MRALLEVADLEVRIGHRVLVRRASFPVNAGEVWAIVGANGAGKTLLLDTLAGLRRPDGGEVRLSGRPMAAWSALQAARARAYMPQSLDDPFSATVLDTVMLGRHPHLSRWSWESGQDRRMALSALASVDVAYLARQDVRTLSGGERQRVAVAALLVQEAPLLLLDEPVAHLDIHHRIAVLGVLAARARNQRKAILFSIHEPELACRFATHALLFRRHGALDSGPVHEVLGEEALSEALLHPMKRAMVDGRVVFLPR